jgi:AcrR family transcriptional regulator
MSETKDTKTRIVEAAIETLKSEGITGASARAIARTGDFNQALIFYHFGSVEEVMMAAISHTSSQRIERYRQRLEGLTTLPELVAIGAELHGEDMEEGNLTVLTQLMAGAAGNDEMGKRLRDEFQPWIDVVTESVAGVLENTPLKGQVPTEDLAYAIASMFLGAELLTHLDRDQANETLFDSLSVFADIVQNLLGMSNLFNFDNS